MNENLQTIRVSPQQEIGLVHFAREAVKNTGVSEAILLNSDIYINGKKLNCEYWESTTVCESDVVEIVPNVHAGAIAAGIVAAVGLTGVAATVATVALTVVISAAISFGLSWAISKLFPAPKPKAPNVSAQRQESLPTIQGATNSYRPFEPLPVVVGTFRATPDFAVPFYSVVRGYSQEIRHLFCVGAGDIDVWDIRRDDTSIEDLGIEYRIYKGWRGENIEWFERTPSTTQENFALKSYQVFKAESPTNVSGFSVVINFPGGLRKQRMSDGDIQSIGINVYTKLTDEQGNIQNFSDYIYNSSPNLSSFLGGVSKDFASGKYKIEIYANFYKGAIGNFIEDNGHKSFTTECYITEVTWFKDEKAVKYSGQAITLIALNAVANDRLSGSLNTINCMARLKGKKRDGTLVDSSNLALQTRRIMTDPDLIQNSEYVILNEDSFDEFEAHCDKYGFTANTFATDGRALGEVVSDILEIGQGYINGASGVYEIFYDNPLQPYVDVITSRNSWGLTISSARNIKTVDGIRINFNNAAADYQVDERLVPLFEDTEPKNAQLLSNSMIDNADLAYKYGRLNLIMGYLRNSIYKFSTDWRSIDYKIGQKLLVQSPAFFLGVGTEGKILDYVIDSNGGYRAVILDQSYSVDAGKSYTLLSTTKYSTKYWDISVNENDTTHTLYFDAPIFDIKDVPEIGEHVVFGETGKEGVEVLIRNITRKTNFSAEVECIPSLEGFYEAIEGEIPEFESSLSFPSSWMKNKPYSPNIVDIKILRDTPILDAYNKLFAQAKITFNYVDKVGVEFGHLVVGIRQKSDQNQEFEYYTTNNKTTFVLPSVQQGVVYDITVRAVSIIGLYSDTVSAIFEPLELMEPMPKVPDVTTVFDGRLNIAFGIVTDWRPFNYEVWHGSSIETAKLVYQSREKKNVAIPTTGYYHVVATSGLVYGEVTTIEVENVRGEGLAKNVVSTFEAAAINWDGVKEGFDLEAGVITLSPDFVSSGEQAYYYPPSTEDVLLSASAECNIFFEIDERAFNLNENFYAVPDVYALEDVYLGVTQGWYLNIDIQVMAGGAWGEWRQLYPAKYVGEGFRFRLRGYVEETDISIECRNFKVVVDVPDLVQTFNKINVPVDGIDIEFNPPFNEIPTVTGIVLNANANIIVNDNDITKTGARVYVEDLQGNKVQQLCNFVAQGY